jgi:exonuclease VII large subunit
MELARCLRNLQAQLVSDFSTVKAAEAKCRWSSEEDALFARRIEMSTSSISSMFSQLQQFQQEFQQLGQDLSSGNLSAAKSDFVTLQSDLPQANSKSTAQSNNPIAQAFSQLSQDLQAGNLSAAQQDYSTIQQDFQSQASQTHHHHHHAGGSQESQVSKLLDQLGQDLQSGNLSSAQSTFSSLQQLLQSNTSSSTSSGSTYTGVSVTA